MMPSEGGWRFLLWPWLQRKLGASGSGPQGWPGVRTKTHSPRMGPGKLELWIFTQSPHPGLGHRSPAPMGPMESDPKLREGTWAGTPACATLGCEVGNKMEKGPRRVIPLCLKVRREENAGALLI